MKVIRFMLCLGILVVAAGRGWGVDVYIPAVTHIEVTPAEESAVVGDNLYFIATAHYDDGSSADVTRNSTWYTNEPENTVTSGLYIPYSAGTWTVTAEYEDFGGEVAKRASVGGDIYSDEATVTVTLVPTDVEAVDSTDSLINFYATGVQMSILGLTGSGDITVEVYSGTNPPGLPGGNPVNKYFTIEAGSGISGFQVIITFSYTDAELAASDITDETTLYCARYDTVAGEWVAMPSTVDTAANTVSCTTTHFSTWGIGGDGGGLPVALASFNAVRGADGVALAWQTVSENNSLGFNVLRQDAAGDLEKINGSLIASLGADGGAYSFTDENAPAVGCSYYLEQVDVDGTTAMAGPVSVTGAAGILTTAAAGSEAPAVHFLQENGSVYARLQLNGPVRISCSDLAGAVMSVQEYDAGSGSTFRIMENVPAGMYLVRITGSALDITRRVMVVR